MSDFSFAYPELKIRLSSSKIALGVHYHFSPWDGRKAVPALNSMLKTLSADVAYEVRWEHCITQVFEVVKNLMLHN